MIRNEIIIFQSVEIYKHLWHLDNDLILVQVKHMVQWNSWLCLKIKIQYRWLNSIETFCVHYSVVTLCILNQMCILWTEAGVKCSWQGSTFVITPCTPSHLTLPSLSPPYIQATGPEQTQRCLNFNTKFRAYLLGIKGIRKDCNNWSG